MDKEENIKKIIDKYNKSLEKLLPKLEKETNEFIQFIEDNKKDYFVNRENGNKKFVLNFDNIIEYRLDFLMYPQTKKFFDKLLYYWEKINLESAQWYKNKYNKIWEE